MCACGTNAQLMMTNLDGTGAMGVGAPLNADVMALAADANWLYVAACVNMGGYVALSQLDAYSLTGGATRTIGTFTQAACLPYAFNESIAVDSKYVYYDAFSGNVGQTSYTLYGWMNDVWTRELSSGGSPSTLQNNAFMKLLTDGTSDFAIVPSGIVYQFPEAGSVANATTIYSSANDFDMDASYVYVTDTSNGTIDRLPKH